MEVTYYFSYRNLFPRALGVRESQIIFKGERVEVLSELFCFCFLFADFPVNLFPLCIFNDCCHEFGWPTSHAGDLLALRTSAWEARNRLEIRVIPVNFISTTPLSSYAWDFSDQGFVKVILGDGGIFLRGMRKNGWSERRQIVCQYLWSFFITCRGIVYLPPGGIPDELCDRDARRLA